MFNGRKKQEFQKEFDRLGIILFDPPLPPARVALPSPNEKELGFRTDEERQELESKCRKEVTRRCVQGARQGCTMSALRQCKTPWVLQFLGWREKDSQEVEICRDKIMKECVTDAEIKCIGHASGFCSVAFAVNQDEATSTNGSYPSGWLGR